MRRSRAEQSAQRRGRRGEERRGGKRGFRRREEDETMCYIDDPATRERGEGRGEVGKECKRSQGGGGNRTFLVFFFLEAADWAFEDAAVLVVSANLTSHLLAHMSLSRQLLLPPPGT